MAELREKKSKPSGALIFFTVLFNPLWLAAGGMGLYHLLQVCRFGSLSRNLRLGVIWGAGCAAWVLIWVILFAILRRDLLEGTGRRGVWRAVLAAEVLALGLMVGWGGAKLVQTAGDMTTRLGRNLYECTHVETIYLKQDNLYTDGLDAIFQKLDEALEMPEELYVASSVQVSFDASGTLTGLYAFLYGADDQGETKSYLFDYNSADSAHVTVWLDGTVNADFAEETRLESMLALMGKLDLEQEVAGWQSEEYRLLYYGSRSFSAGQENLIVVDDQGGQTAVGEAVQGFEVSLYISGKADAVGAEAPRRYFCGWEALAIGAQVSQTQEAEGERQIGVSFVNQSGNPEFYLTEALGWQLEVVDAAAGSRFYRLNCTEDGGQSWQVLNEDPFLGAIGANAELYFVDEQLGFLLLPNADSRYSRLYRTGDGGVSFELVELNAGDEDLDAPSLPTLEDGRLRLEVGGGTDGSGDTVVLYSDDLGVTWSQG